MKIERLNDILLGRFQIRVNPRSSAASLLVCGNLFSPLHLIAKDAFDDFRISAAPTAEQGIVDRKRIFDGCEFLVFLIQSVVRGRTEIKLYERPLRFFAP